MQKRTVKVEYSRPRGYDVGYRAENNFTMLALPVPTELEGADSYRVYFESTVGEYLQTELLTPTDGYVTVKITSDIVPEPGNMAAQLVAFADGEIVGYAPMITGSAKVSIPDGTERLSHSLAAEIALNTAARHSHDNKAVLDKFAESDGKPTYDGQALGGGAGDFIIKMTVEVDGDNYTVTSCDKTIEQIDAAVASGQNIKAIAFDKYIMPLIQMEYSESYVFGVFISSLLVVATVTKYPEPGANAWQFYSSPLTADLIEYSNAELPISVRDVETALDKLVSKSHTHANKDVLDKLSVADGKLKYDGSDVGLKGDTGATGAQGAKGDKGDTGAKGADGKTPVKGTDYWTAADKQEIIDDIHPAYYIDLTGNYPNYTCPVAMDDIKAAYNSGYNLVCRCTLGAYTATLPLFIPMPSVNTWIFSGSGCLQSMGFPAQSFTVAITANGVVAQQMRLARADGTFPNPYSLNITVGDTAYSYDGSETVNVVIDDGTEVSY